MERAKSRVKPQISGKYQHGKVLGLSYPGQEDEVRILFKRLEGFREEEEGRDPQGTTPSTSSRARNELKRLAWGVNYEGRESGSSRVRVKKNVGVVYEQGLAAVKIPKSILNGPGLLLMGFPECGSSYFLLMQLDKDFKPLFKLLETQPDPSRRSHPVGDSNHVIRINKIDIGQMQMLEDELNLSLLDWGKILSSLPNAGGPNQTFTHGLLSEFGLEASSMQIAGFPQSSFLSVVDEVFELEKGALEPPPSVQNLSSSFNTSHVSHFGSVQMNHQGIKVGISSSKWEGGLQLSQINNTTKVSSEDPHFNSSQYPSSNLKGLSISVNSLSSSPGRSPSIQKLSASKSDQDLASLRSLHSVEVGPCSAMDEDQVRLLNESSKEVVSGSRPSRLLSQLRPTGAQVSLPSAKPNVLRSSPPLVGSFRAAGSCSWTTRPACQTSEAGIHLSSSDDFIQKHDKNLRKRSLSDILKLIPSLQGIEVSTGYCKRRKISEPARMSQPQASQALISLEMNCKTEGCTFGNILNKANRGNAPSSIYVIALLHVVRHCSLCIKHARLTSQMDSLGIPYVEEVGLRSPSSNLWFRLPFVRGNSWQHICLRLGRPGSMYWDVKINDQHFRDLWELQKGSSSTPWGYGVRIANTSDIDSHIRYDPEGVLLSYLSVEADSIKKLVADLRRLSNARMFALGMRKLLGVRADEKIEESNANSESKVPIGTKGAVGVVDKISEQMRRAFRIEAVGLTSLWFSFGPGVVARFVVEWESCKEGCTMHVSPDQLWPHTKVCARGIFSYV
ncbi:hypothetical protein HHK36_020549 [Tetracentron sinense]|uniref:Uncharacterized protein n=1 Tax=Tetracentron sinense TaxID=13715 RepID=A0A834YZ71_TETSI|nr:hypothetical protein HHK36_020549 [Tetracentron sinense]